MMIGDKYSISINFFINCGDVEQKRIGENGFLAYKTITDCSFIGAIQFIFESELPDLDTIKGVVLYCDSDMKIQKMDIDVKSKIDGDSLYVKGVIPKDLLVLSVDILYSRNKSCEFLK